MTNNVNTVSNIQDYSNLMLMLNATRGMVKNSFTGSLALYDNAIQVFIDDLCKNTALTLWGQGYDKSSIQSILSLSDEHYDVINELIHDDYLLSLVSDRLNKTSDNISFSQSEIMSAFDMSQEDLDNAEDDELI
jgi:hypothetical protein